MEDFQFVLSDDGPKLNFKNRTGYILHTGRQATSFIEKNSDDETKKVSTLRHHRLLAALVVSFLFLSPLSLLFLLFSFFSLFFSFKIFLKTGKNINKRKRTKHI